ncbi:hypothetical protein RCH09_000022 [Actimicrobium sp. GrIS 1.19]|uniref:CZB domain-containing protein n=1 Tax=Actimicrobium sp. GrIS 1.19 TaxID=3071708 RepID=UPI002E05BD3B|nr:hypothetical protein [Actimicrobium sp. GrIS 1.19]
MDLIDAIAKDKEFRNKFAAAIAAKVQLDAATIAKTDRCVLGNWLHGEATRTCMFLKSYKPCLEAHAAFHVQAAKVVREINGAEYVDAQAMLAGSGAFAKSFGVLEAAVLLLKKEAKM